MATQIEIIEIEEPILEFGGVISSSDPKEGLTEAGPFDLRFGNARKVSINIGFIGEEVMIEKAIKWLNRCQNFISSGMKNLEQYPHFPGFKNVFKAELNFNTKWNYVLAGGTITEILNQKATIAFKDALDIWEKGMIELTKLETLKPDVIFCCLSDEVVAKCWSIQNALVKSKDKKKVKKLDQLALFELSEAAVEPIEEQQEDILKRDFRRALKARAMKYGVPIQIGTNNLFEDSTKNQDPAVRAWNCSIALYYKSGGIPWRIKRTGPETCFVGISFHHLYTTHNKHLVRSCIAQAFSSDGEGFAIRGVNVPWTEEQGMNVHLTETQAFDLGERILEEYRHRTGSTPLRIVLHKSTAFNEAEEQGLRSALNNVPIIELINLAPTDFRMVRFGEYPPKRGTLCLVNEDAAFLFTTGYMPKIKTYPGPHIPVPIQIKTTKDVDIKRAAADVISLTRMNWNTSSITGGQPVTLRFSRMVGGIMAEYGDNEPPSSFRFYL
jgi:hypothetical protein